MPQDALVSRLQHVVKSLQGLQQVTDSISSQVDADPALVLEKVRKPSDLAGVTSNEDDALFTPSPDSDLSKPLSELLRTETKGVHDEIHHSEAANALIAGKLARSEYIRFLFMLWHIYE